MNRNIGITAAVVVAAIVGIGIFFSSDILQETSQQEIDLIMNMWAGYGHAIIADDRGFFKDSGVPVNLKVVKEYPDMITIFLDGEYDGFFGVYSDVILLSNQGAPLKVVYVVDYSNGGDVIISKPQIRAVADLKGKTIAIEEYNSFSHLFLFDLLTRNGLTESDVTLVEIPAHQVLDALDSGIIDAGHTWEPTQSEALAKGYRLLATSADTPGIITDVLAFKKSVVEKRPDDIKKIILAMDRALEYRDTAPLRSYKIMSDATGVLPSSLKKSIQGSSFPDLNENKEAFTELEKSTSLFYSGKIISDFFVDKGIISAPINLKDLLATEIISDL